VERRKWSRAWTGNRSGRGFHTHNDARPESFRAKTTVGCRKRDYGKLALFTRPPAGTFRKSDFSVIPRNRVIPLRKALGENRRHGPSLVVRRCQFVFTITADSLSPVILAVERCVAMKAYSIRACRNLADGFTESSYDLNTSAARLETGEFRTILVRPEGGNIEFSLIHHPSSYERTLSLYSATFEYTSPDWSNLWNLLLGFPKLAKRFAGYGARRRADRHFAHARIVSLECGSILRARTGRTTF
jgi:hypothetical protein